MFLFIILCFGFFFSHILILYGRFFLIVEKKISANIGAIDVGAFGLMFDGIGGPINPNIHDVLITIVFGVLFLTYLLVFLSLVIMFLLLP
jgi:hypothetical protein